MAKYDVIVVGAGPGGTVAAKTAAQKGLKVLMLERARTPGDKNMSGSYLFRDINNELWPGFEEQDFNKNHIRLGGIFFQWVLDNDEKRYGVSMSPGATAIKDMMTVYRNESDKWFAEQAVKAGAELKTALVTDVIWENEGQDDRRVVGVISDAGDFYAPVVIDASGLHSVIARKTRLVEWHHDKIMLGLKYIYKVDGDVLRDRMRTYYDTDGAEVDWGCMPTLCGSVPEFWAAHAIGEPGRGICNLVIYMCLEEMIKNRINIHQRMQWFTEQAPICQLIEGGEWIYCNFHSLAAGDLQGYAPKGYMHGLMLVGDAGGYGMPMDNFGANVAQMQGKIAGELAAEMKAKKDYSEAMFAKYDDRWGATWIGEDNIPEFNILLRRGPLQKIFGFMDEAASGFLSQKMKNKSYAAMFGSILPKALPLVPVLTQVGYAFKGVLDTGVKKAGGLMAMFGMGQQD